MRCTCTKFTHYFLFLLDIYSVIKCAERKSPKLNTSHSTDENILYAEVKRGPDPHFVPFNRIQTTFTLLKLILTNDSQGNEYILIESCRGNRSY